MFKINNKDTRTYFIPCSTVSMVNFEHVIAGWEVIGIVLQVYGSTHLRRFARFLTIGSI